CKPEPEVPYCGVLGRVGTARGKYHAVGGQCGAVPSGVLGIAGSTVLIDDPRDVRGVFVGNLKRASRVGCCGLKRNASGGNRPAAGVSDLVEELTVDVQHNLDCLVPGGRGLYD